MIVGAAGLIALLSGSSALAALSAGRVFLNVGDEQTALPYIVVSETRDNDKTLEGATDIRTVTYNITAWANSATQAEATADAIESTIDAANNGIEVLARTGGFDPDTMTDCSVLVANELG